MSTPATDTGIRTFAALRHRGYRGYITGGFSAMLGDSIEHVISYWMIFQTFHSPMLGGFAIFSHWIPFLLLSVYSGALADRFGDQIAFATLAIPGLLAALLAWTVLPETRQRPAAQPA